MYKKIASNTLAQVTSKVATAIISIFLISILTNFLSVEMYGLYSKVYNYIGIFVFLADLWLYAITIREITNNKEQASKIVGNVMSLRLFLWIIILVLSVMIAYFIPGYNDSLALLSIAIASIFTIVQLLNSSILALMQAYMKIEFSLFSTVFSKMVNLGAIAAIAYYYTWIAESDFFIPFLSIMGVWVLWVSINTLLNYFYARKITPITFQIDWEYLKYIFKISLPYGIALFLSVVYFKVDIILLSILEWPEYWDLSIALYSLPMKIIEVLMVVWGFYLSSILPSLTKFFEEKNTRKLDELIQISFQLLFGAAACVFTLGVLFRDYIIEIIANRNYLETTHMYNSSDAFLIVFAVVLFYFISLIFIYCLVASHNQAKLLKINICVTIFNIVGNIILIPKYSFIWAGITTLLSQVLLLVLWYYFTKKLIIFSLPKMFITQVLIFSLWLYTILYVLLSHYSFGLYVDFFLFGWVWFIIYAIFLLYHFKKFIKKS